MTIERRISRRIYVGSVPIGGGAPISVQSMTNTDTRDIEATARQIEALAEAGCEIVRVAVPEREAAKALKDIVKSSRLPVIADIHFDYRLALASLDAGVHGLRLNPGNIGGQDKVNMIIDVLKDRPVPVRIGVNSGSLERKLQDKYGGPTPEAMVESALGQIELFARRDYHELKISVKSFSINSTVEAYSLLADKVDYPFHIGITEAGIMPQAAVRSAVGIGVLLYQGLGDTLRVSITGDPVPEVEVGWEILKSLGLRQRGPVIISCPTCARCRYDLVSIVNEVEKGLRGVNAPITVAVMGCEVNGPGEARQADVGIAGGARDKGILFRRGEKVEVVDLDQMVDRLLEEIKIIAAGDEPL